MECKKRLAYFLIFLLSASFLIARQQENPQKESLAQKGKRSLIRKELLSKDIKAPQPPQRNIFSPRRSQTKGVNANPVEIPQNFQKLQNAIEQQAPSRPALNLSYIGYIVSGDNIIAVIILEGDVLAVKKGDVLAEGVSVGEITPLEIEILGPDSEKKKYSIQGDEE